MLSAFRSTQRGPSSWARRIALFALIALEMAIVVSPLLEPHHTAPETHVEQSGATHHFVVHNEATCAICTLRSMGQLPAAAPLPLSGTAPIVVAGAREHVTVLSRDEVAHSPRAPPVLG
jgi:hypothetical protein